MRRLGLTCALAAALLVTGCAKNPVSTNSTSNPNVEVDKLFTFDGCTIYRFTDNNNYIYYSKCGSSSDVSWQQPKGKTSYPTEVVTSYE